MPVCNLYTTHSVLIIYCHILPLFYLSTTDKLHQPPIPPTPTPQGKGATTYTTQIPHTNDKYVLYMYVCSTYIFYILATYNTICSTYIYYLYAAFILPIQHDYRQIDTTYVLHTYYHIAPMYHLFGCTSYCIFPIQHMQLPSHPKGGIP